MSLARAVNLENELHQIVNTQQVQHNTCTIKFKLMFISFFFLI